MKRIIVLLMATAFLYPVFAKTTVSGTIKGLRSGTVEISYYHPVTYQKYSWEGKIEKGKFSLEADINRPVFADLMLNEERTGIYLTPDAQLQVAVNYDEFDESITYSGTLAAENNFMKAYFLAFEDAGKDSTRYWYSSYEATEFQQQHEARLQSMLQFIDDYNKKNNLSKEFYKIWSNDKTYNMYGTLLYYPALRAYITHQEPENVVDEAYFEFLQNCSFNNDSLIYLNGYMYFNTNYLQYKMSQVQLESKGSMNYINKFLLADMIFSGKCKTAVQAAYLRNALRYMDLKELEPYWKDFIASCDEEVAGYMTEIYQRVLDLQPGNPAPTFTLFDMEGNKVSLSDFKGKVVYIDFWASWCGPCMMEVPHAVELHEKYAAEKNLVFLFISIDENEDAWRKTVKEKQPDGVHVIAKGFKHEVPVSYNVSGIPTYYIIGKDGNIYKGNAPRPSHGTSLTDMLDAALAE
ncbi:redoxin domain-containing protein [bacterium]|nr:redoxin domain-containing protein [bacterium]